jgi:hypothetical protein
MPSGTNGGQPFSRIYPLLRRSPDLRLGRKILSADPSQVWQSREVETAPTAEPQMWRDWNLEPWGLDAEQDGAGDYLGCDLATA